MGRNTRFPELFNDVLRLNISTLKEYGYLEDVEVKKGVLSWLINGEKVSSITIFSRITKKEKFVLLEYLKNEEKVICEIELTTINSNIGKGDIWYFVCPMTKKRCRILYLMSDKFLHRDAFPKGMYETQTYSKNNRMLFNRFKIPFEKDEAYKIVNSKYFKRYYKGKPTKRFLRLLSIIDEDEVNLLQT